ncbi:uncharacterized protein LOC142977327 isoform X2 [Anticarsia gemmatalis]|uniref:uncharacterized protein LOC142977327 isoform X2 n=1 Tax=Anticarsia gemmatalis TaxID=129554 RepID=UPI003F75A4EC
MSWPVPNAAQWNSAMAITPEINVGSYTAEQWAAMQQQNWQQWTQWQQQYAQWQSQYGEKYAEQMRALQAMGGMPPLPPSNAAPPPAPPPPDKPPPPPHENNQPLYNHTPSQPTPVPAPSANQPRKVNTGNNININTHPQAGNNSNWSYTQEQSPSSVNAEALKKLAEEERLFDIQFKKWEEEIEKWKKDNVDHPDKQAYREYEEKFEACRAQLLERRQQMNKKKARLLGNAPPPPPTQAVVSAANVNTRPPLPVNTSNAYPNNNIKQSQSYGNNSQNYLEQSKAPYQYQPYSKPQNTFAGNNINIDSQDRFDSYSHGEKYPSKDSFTAPPINPSFLLASESSKKGIPGLDLVLDTDKAFGANVKQDVIDITGENLQAQPSSKGPDYTTISKGINNILGDAKIMNILSMVRGQAGPDNMNNAPGNPSGPYSGNSQSISPYDQGYRNQNFNNQPYEQRQNIMPYNRQGGNNPMLQNQDGPRHPTQTKLMDERQDEMQQDQYNNYDRSSQYGTNNIGLSYNNIPAGAPPPVRPGQRAPLRPLLQEMPGQQNVMEYPRGPPGHPGPIVPQGSVLSERHPLMESNINPPIPSQPKWVDEPMLTPSIIVEYDHKPLRLKARNFIEPVHMFDYNHKSKDEDVKKSRDFADELFVRKPRRTEKEMDHSGDRYSRDYYSRDYERRAPRDDLRDEIRPRGPPRDDYEDRRRIDDDRRRIDDSRKLDEDRRRLDSRYDDRRREDRDKYGRRDDMYRERERDFHRDRDRGRDVRREDIRHRSRSRERDTRKRGLSRDSDLNDIYSKRPRDKDNLPAAQFEQPKHIVMIDDILEAPGREMRPEKIVIILRGPPGSGKSYLAKLIRDKEAEHGGTVRIMSIDDYFMQEGEVEEKDPTTGKMVKKPTLKYEYDHKSEETYLNSLKRAFKRSLTDGYFTFIVFDAVNETLKSYADVWNVSRQNDFQVYICTMELDPQICYKRNIHGRTLAEIESIADRFYHTPPHHIQLDATTLLQSAAITEVHMEDADDEVVMEDTQEPEVESVFTSKWEKMDDAAQLARLDGTSKPLRSSQLSMEDYLQLDDWKPNTAKPGKKTVPKMFVSTMVKSQKTR